MLLHVKRCVGLRSADLFGKSDPYVTISVEGGERFKTRVTDNDNSPVIDEMYYLPGKTPMIRFTVLDADDALGGSDDVLGEFKLGFPKPVTSTEWRSVKGTLEGKKAKGVLELAVRLYTPTRVTLNSAKGLRNADGMFNKSDPFAKLYGLIDEAGNQAARWGTTRVVDDDLNPTWGESFTIDFEGRLPRGGRLSPLKIIVLDYDKGSAISSADVDTLGKVTVPWTDAFATEPRRVSLSLKYKGSKAGKVDVTFEALAANDDGAPFPAQRTSTSADDAEARIRELEAQLRIRELEAQLAAATMGQPAASPAASPSASPPLARPAQPAGQYPPMATPVAQPATPAPQLMRVQVPAGCAPGSPLIVTAPSGQQLQVTVPHGVHQGMFFQVEIPSQLQNVC